MAISVNANYSYALVLGLVIFLSGNDVMCDDSFLSDYDEYDIPPSSTSSELNAGYHCFEEMCVCRNATADCSRNEKNLTFVPRLPDNVTFLDFSYNEVHEIPDDFFLNVTNITGLDLSHNGIAGIGSGAFRPLDKLQTLILNYNHRLTYNIMLPVFLLPGLKRLELAHIKLGFFPTQLFQLFPMANLEILNLQDNEIKANLPYNNFDLAVFSRLTKLRVLSLSGNKFTSVVSAHFSSLEDLDLSNSYVLDFPSTCDGDTSLFPSLQSLNLVGIFPIMAFPTHVCLPKLRILRISLNAVSPHTFTDTRFPDLRELYINRHYSSGLSEHAFMSTTLQLLSIDCSLGSFSDDNVNNQCLEGCTNLSTLVFIHCDFGSVSSSKLHRILSSLPKLKHLGLESTSITTITDEIFTPLQSLTSLDLHGNFIKEIPDGVFDALLNLTSLDLSNNLISTMRAFSSRARQTLIHLDLSGNPFTCSCDLMWIRNWQASNPAIFGNTWSQYTCSLNYGQHLINMSSFYLNKWTCAFSYIVYLVIIIISSSIIVCIVISASVYPLYVSLTPLVYRAILDIRGNARKEINKCRDDYKYDVFVAYASEDTNWIRKHLMPQLEEKRGLKLCVSDRDFTPGKEIVANITDSLEVSRQVMVIFSTDFARSPWCQYELTLCLTHALENAYDLLVVYLHDIPPWEMTKKMSAVLKTCTYLQWSDNQEIQRLFWFKLQEALFDVTQAAAQAALRETNQGAARNDHDDIIRGGMRIFQLTEIVARDFNREADLAQRPERAFNTDADDVIGNAANDVIRNFQDDLVQIPENGAMGMSGNVVVGAAANDVMRSTVRVLIHNDRPQHL